VPEDKIPKIDNKPFFEKLKDTFRPTKISHEEETMFDVCMKCGVRLPDKKLLTLKEHQRTEHPMTSKDKRSAFMYKHLLPVMIAIMFSAVAVFMILPETGFVFDPFGTILGVADPSEIDIVICTDRTIELKTRMYEQGEFRSSDADDFNYLLENCNASFWSYKYGDTLFETDYYSAEKIAERSNPSIGGSRSIGE